MVPNGIPLIAARTIADSPLVVNLQPICAHCLSAVAASDSSIAGAASELCEVSTAAKNAGDSDPSLLEPVAGWA